MSPSSKQTDRQAFSKVQSCSLPVFLRKGTEWDALYAPGTVCAVAASHTEAVLRRMGVLAGGGDPSIDGSQVPDVALCLVNAGRTVLEERAALMRAEFDPECLTLFLDNMCDLQCRYCYTAARRMEDLSVTPEAVRAAADLVAACCARHRRPLTVAFHGGGEPTRDMNRLAALLSIVRDVARVHGLRLRTYLATNGVLSEDNTEWAARHFDLIGVSCDGPPEIQDRQRPFRNGCPSFALVDRALSRLRQSGRSFIIRVTLTAEHFSRQAEIVEYLASRYAPGEIRMEPVYVNPASEPVPGVGDAPVFVEGFWAARHAAKAAGIRMGTSLTRPALWYGPYCNALRNVLNLTPGDWATGCFLESDMAGIERRGVKMGAMNKETGRFELDEKRIRWLKKKGAEIPIRCADCICVFQCVHGCPDECLLKDEASESSRTPSVESFRCRANRLLLGRFIMEAAEYAWKGRGPASEEKPTAAVCPAGFLDA